MGFMEIGRPVPGRLKGSEAVGVEDAVGIVVATGVGDGVGAVVGEGVGVGESDGVGVGEGSGVGVGVGEAVGVGIGVGVAFLAGAAMACAQMDRKRNNPMVVALGILNVRRKFATSVSPVGTARIAGMFESDAIAFVERYNRSAIGSPIHKIVINVSTSAAPYGLRWPGYRAPILCIRSGRVTDDAGSRRKVVAGPSRAAIHR